jgi:hypothetical protein
VPLGRSPVIDDAALAPERPSFTSINVTSSLWPNRWPAIALQECRDAVSEAPLLARAEVKRNLPCKSCPENTRCLVAKQKEQGPLLYGREMLTEPRSQEASLFPRSLMAPMLDPGRGCVPHYLKAAGRERIEWVASAWDLAWSEKIGGDYLCKITGMLNLRTGRKSVLDINRWQGLTYTQQCELIVQQHRLYHDDAVVLESDAAQVIWAQTLEETSEVPVLRHAAGDDKRSLHIGVPALLIDFSNRRWSFPYQEGGLRVDEVENLLVELGAFGYNNGKLEGVGEHDDTVMALWHLWWALNLAGGTMQEYRLGVTSGRAP